MGLFCANIHLQTADVVAVRDHVDPTAVVLDAEQGWVTLYTPRLLEGGAEEIEEMAAALSAKLGVRAVSFWIYDSDIACYWLHDSGSLIDHHNSWPDYFDEEPSQAGAGDPDVLASFCPKGTQAEDLRRLLTADATFAEEIAAGVATAIGIPRDRVLRDYRDTTEDAPEVGVPDLEALAGLNELFPDVAGPEASESAVALVAAAVGGDVLELRRIAATGAPLDDEAPAPLPGGQSLAGLGMAIPGKIPEVPMTPLIAAIAHAQADAVTALLDLGADPNHQHALHGSPVHAAAGSGNPELLAMVLDAGGDPHVRNQQGQTPLQVLTASRQQLDLLKQATDLLSSMGAATPEVIEQLAPSAELAVGWNACEAILHLRGAAND